MGFENIDHFDLMVSDVDRALAFYRGLGMETTERKNGVGRLVKQLVLGEKERINLTTPADTEPQGRTVLAGGGHVCFAWKGTMDEVLATSARNGIAPQARAETHSAGRGLPGLLQRPRQQPRRDHGLPGVAARARAPRAVLLTGLGWCGPLRQSPAIRGLVR